LLGNHALNLFKHITDARHHVAGCEADNMETVSIEPCGTARIVNRLHCLSMLVAIDLDYEADWKATEIGKVRTQWKLASEAIAVNGLAPKVSPQFLLCF
jgi:hypothetical protein